MKIYRKVNKFFKALSSLRLTLVLFVLLFIQVLVMTFGQVQLGIYQSKLRFFDTLFITIPIGEWNIPIFPGGWLVGGLLVLNLLIATVTKFKLTIDKLGIWLIHIGLLVLLISSGLISYLTIESQMSIREGQTLNYSEDVRHMELVVIEKRASQDRVISFPEAALRTQKTLSHEELPFAIHIDRFYQNAQLNTIAHQAADTSKTIQGIGQFISVKESRPIVKEGYVNFVTVYATIQAPESGNASTKDGDNFGTFLLSNGLSVYQTISVEDTTYYMAIRRTRYYTPHSLTLLDFNHEKYLGSDIPKDFSSRVLIRDSEKGVSQNALIYMNNPLRLNGKTYYQASFGEGDTLSVLQVVENPVWTWPYIATLLMTLGLLIHFLFKLSRSFKRQAAKLVIVIASGLLFSAPLTAEELNTNAIAQLPVVHNGRIKPLDSVARYTLLMIQQNQSTTRISDANTPTEWLLKVTYSPREANLDSIFEVDHPEILDILEINERGKQYVSFQRIHPYWQYINEQAKRARELESPQRNPYDRAVIKLDNALTLYVQLKYSLGNGSQTFTEMLNAFDDFRIQLDKAPIDEILIGDHSRNPLFKETLQYFGTFKQMADTTAFLPIILEFNPNQHTHTPNQLRWASFGDGLISYLGTPSQNISIDTYKSIAQSMNSNPASVNAQVQNYLSAIKKATPMMHLKTKTEFYFNKIQPFYYAILIYLTAIFLIIVYWLNRNPKWNQWAFNLIAAGFSIHTIGLIIRMWLTGRPPVTNLYSSAIFIGWFAIIMGLILERRYQNSMGNMVSAVIGALTLIIAHHLSLQGDTMEMMQAVLDSNFWLATHVVTVTMGYSATFLAGFLGILYVILGTLTRKLNKELDHSLASMMYGIICFALLMSFVGTVLGGIWADQSWGRFWGWDPKENGALLIVIWNAIILHARMIGIIRHRGLALTAIFGNIVTSFSWFGVNMLGIGLHSYGFMDKSFIWLVMFTFSQLIIIWLGSLPMEYWKSHKNR